MRTNGLVASVVALGAAFAILIAVPGCKAHGPETASATQAHGRSVADIARGIGLELGTGPRNAAALQAEEPAAAAFRGGIEGLAESATSNPAATPDPDDWGIVTGSLSLFRHAPYVADLMLGMGLSIAMALLLTAWPRSLVARDPVAATEERNGGVILALVGSLAAELVQSSEQLSLGAEIALVLFGIGGLIRFRTVFGDPRRTGLMILITILGLCCGMSQYSLAVLAFTVIWLVRYFLLSSVMLVVQVRAPKGGDVEQVRAATMAAIHNRGARVLTSTVRRGGRMLEIHARARGAVNEGDLKQALEDVLPGSRVQVSAS